jgi:polyisoprenoid-binding protein YceI
MAAVASLWLAGTAFAAETYTPDPAHTTVGFSARHFVITKVRGRFNDYTASLMYDEKDITKSSLQGTIKVASIDTGNAKRDDHLRSADFFDAAKFPEIKFHSTRVEKRGDAYVMVGPLTIRDVTKEVTVPFNVTGKVTDPTGKERVGFDAYLRIKRKDFGVSWDKTMDNGSLIVSDDIDIELVVEAVKK